MGLGSWVPILASMARASSQKRLEDEEMRRWKENQDRLMRQLAIQEQSFDLDKQITQRQMEAQKQGDFRNLMNQMVSQPGGKEYKKGFEQQLGAANKIIPEITGAMGGVKVSPGLSLNKMSGTPKGYFDFIADDAERKRVESRVGKLEKDMKRNADIGNVEAIEKLAKEHYELTGNEEYGNYSYILGLQNQQKIGTGIRKGGVDLENAIERLKQLREETGTNIKRTSKNPNDAFRDELEKSEKIIIEKKNEGNWYEEAWDKTLTRDEQNEAYINAMRNTYKIYTGPNFRKLIIERYLEYILGKVPAPDELNNPEYIKLAEEFLRNK